MTWRVTGRPKVPEGYGVTSDGDFLTWANVEERLTGAVHYWLATTRPDGRPHVVPRWGVWLDNAFWYDGSPKTRHALNAEANPRCALHLEDGGSPTIVEGISEVPLPIEGELGERLSADFRRKYETLGYAPSPNAWSGEDSGGMRRLGPISAVAWNTFPDDLTRFSYD